MRRSFKEESKIERGEVNEGTCAAEEWEWKNVKDKKWGGERDRELQVGGGLIIERRGRPQKRGENGGGGGGAQVIHRSAC